MSTRDKNNNNNNKKTHRAFSGRRFTKDTVAQKLIAFCSGWAKDNPPPHPAPPRPAPTRTPNLYWLMLHKLCPLPRNGKKQYRGPEPQAHTDTCPCLEPRPWASLAAKDRGGRVREKKEPVRRGTSPANAWAPFPTGERSCVQCSRRVAVQTPGCFSAWPAAPPCPATRLATDRDTEGMEVSK